MYGQSDSTDGYGVYGRATANSGPNYGGWFQSDSIYGAGVYSLAIATSGETTGVLAISYSSGGRGAVGRATANSGPNYGGWFQSDSIYGAGVYSLAIATSGETTGVLAISYSSGGRGAVGRATANSGQTYGVYGRSNSPDGYGVYSYGRFAATGTKSFQMDHPLSPETHYLNHFCAEGPEPLNAYSGNVVTDARGYAIVQLPDYFETINHDFRYQLTVVDDGDDFVLAKVVQKIRNNQFVIRTSKPFVEVSWRVEAIRNDPWVQKYGYQTEPEKPKEHQGKYLHPELYGQPKEKSIHYHPEPERPEPNDTPKP